MHLVEISLCLYASACNCREEANGVRMNMYKDCSPSVNLVGCPPATVIGVCLEYQRQADQHHDSIAHITCPRWWWRTKLWHSRATAEPSLWIWSRRRVGFCFRTGHDPLHLDPQAVGDFLAQHWTTTLQRKQLLAINKSSIC